MTIQIKITHCEPDSKRRICVDIGGVTHLLDPGDDLTTYIHSPGNQGQALVYESPDPDVATVGRMPNMSAA